MNSIKEHILLKLLKGQKGSPKVYENEHSKFHANQPEGVIVGYSKNECNFRYYHFHQILQLLYCFTYYGKLLYVYAV